MDEQDVRSLAVKLAAVTDRIEKRLDAVARGTMHATQVMERQAQASLAASEQVSAGVRRAAGDALQHGTTEAIDRFGGVVRASEVRLESAAERLERRMLTVGKWQVAFAWKAFVASAFGSFALMGVAGYVIWEARDAARATRWVKQVNAAQAAGRLGVCPSGGEHVCAKVEKRWVRLDP